MRKRLPHFDMLGAYQFITFRTYDSLDEFLIKMKDEKISDKKRRYLIDRHLDKSKKGAYLNGEILEFVYEFLLKNDKNLYELISFSIMPNHIHLLIKQTDDLPMTIQKIKGSLAFSINKILDKNGKFWEYNYFDKAIRDKKHFDTVYEYIKNNPLKANLKDGKKRFYGIYE